MKLNEKRITDTFVKLTAIDSPSYRERQMADYLKAVYEELGITLTEDDTAPLFGGNAGNLFGRVPGTIPGAPILFSGHMDTVDPACGKKAIVHPDGKITSDGTTVLGADDVGCLTAVLEAVRYLKETGTLHRELELMFSPGEEHFSEGTRRFDFTKSRAKLGYVFDLTGPMGTAALQAPGSCHFWLTVHGKAAHAGFAPEDGIHAIAIAADAINKLTFGHTDPVTTVNIGRINGGLMTNIIPESCEVEGEIRSYEDEKIQYELNKILDTFKKAAADKGGSITHKVEWCYKALNTKKDSPAVAFYERACEKIGLPVRLTGTFGMSDCNHFPQHGIEGIVVASAMQQCHSTAEYTTVQDLVKLTELVITLMTQENAE